MVETVPCPIVHINRPFMSLPYPRRQKQLVSLVHRLGLDELSELRWDLLDLALTHASASPTANYEQLEFVGDAVVKLAAATFLLKTYPQLKVGDFTAIRSILVSDRNLATIADQYDFDRYLVVGGSAAADSNGRESRLADSFEAVLAALYLSSQNLDLIHPWLDPLFQASAEKILADPARNNYKAALQTLTQSKQKLLPQYRSREISPVHGDPERFEAEVWLQDQCLGVGRGRSIKAAEQAAAQIAFIQLSEPQPLPQPLSES
nr:ribonuclease III [Alkalinema sp. FACHB-956]